MPTITQDGAVKLVAFYEKAVQKRSTWDGVCANLAALIRPLRIDIRTKRSLGQQQTQNIFDGTAPKAASDLASAMYGSMSPVDMQFFRLVMQYKPLNEDYTVRLWLEECEQRMLLALQQSNFESEVHELYQDLVVFGTGCMLMEENPARGFGFGGFQFRTTPPGRYAILEGADSRVNTIMRVYTMTLESAFGLWGKELSDASLRLLPKQPDESLKILHIMRPSPAEVSGSRKAYESIYIELEQKKLLAQAYHRRLRFLVPRWTKTSEEEYGRGQGHLVYPDVASLNRAVEMRFKQWAKQLDPPVLTTDDGVLGRLRLSAGTRTIVRNIDAVKAFETGARWDVNQFNEGDLRTSIRNGFYADKLQLPNKQYMTAYEIQQQVEIMQRELGPTIGRVKYELLNELIANGFDIMLHANALPAPPEIVQEAAAFGLGSLGINYESPLVRSQRTGDVVAVERTMTAVTPLATVSPEVLDNFDMDWITRHVGESSGLPAQAMRELTAVSDLREAKQAQIQAAQEAAQMEQGSVVAKNVGAATKSFSQANGGESAPANRRPA